MLAAAVACADPLQRPLMDDGAVPVSSTALPMNPSAPGQDQVGVLMWRGGLHVEGSGAGFGGLSALHVWPDGSGFLALSDTGYWVTGRLLIDDAGILTGVSDVRSARLLDLDGEPVSMGQRDAEGLAIDGNGAALVSFERDHRVWRYAVDAAGGLASVPVALPTPPGIEAAPRNGSLESLARLPDGRLVAMAEDLSDDRGNYAWVSDTDGPDLTWQPFRCAGDPDLEVSDATVLPNGDLLVVERGFSLLSGADIRIARVDADAIAPGARIEGIEMARLRPPMTVDNVEGAAVFAGPSGAPLLLLVTDDNFIGLQRTLFLLFEIRVPG